MQIDGDFVRQNSKEEKKLFSGQTENVDGISGDFSLWESFWKIFFPEIPFFQSMHTRTQRENLKAMQSSFQIQFLNVPLVCKGWERVREHEAFWVNDCVQFVIIVFCQSIEKSLLFFLKACASAICNYYYICIVTFSHYKRSVCFVCFRQRVVDYEKRLIIETEPKSFFTAPFLTSIVVWSKINSSANEGNVIIIASDFCCYPIRFLINSGLSCFWKRPLLFLLYWLLQLCLSGS